jgi:hypothetical protein
MILNCLPGGANARFLQGKQQTSRGTARNPQQGLAQGSNGYMQDNTISTEQEFDERPPEQNVSSKRYGLLLVLQTIVKAATTSLDGSDDC